ncbi:hypothetical protein MY4824_009226 [Beauveria thailandica]
MSYYTNTLVTCIVCENAVFITNVDENTALRKINNSYPIEFMADYFHVVEPLYDVTNKIPSGSNLFHMLQYTEAILETSHLTSNYLNENTFTNNMSTPTKNFTPAKNLETEEDMSQYMDKGLNLSDKSDVETHRGDHGGCFAEHPGQATENQCERVARAPHQTRLARVGLPKTSFGPMFETLRASVTSSPGTFIYKDQNGIKAKTQRLDEAIKRIIGSSSKGVATIAISLSDEATIENGRTVPIGNKYQFSVNVDNMFHFKKERVLPHSPPQSSSTGFEILEDIFSVAVRTIDHQHGLQRHRKLLHAGYGQSVRQRQHHKWHRRQQRPEAAATLNQQDTGKLLGKGGFAICYTVHLQPCNKVYALRIIKSHMPPKMEQSICLVLELCPNGSLMDRVKRRKGLTEPEVRFYSVQIAGAIKYMHSKGIIHRDWSVTVFSLDPAMASNAGGVAPTTRLSVGKHLLVLGPIS